MKHYTYHNHCHNTFPLISDLNHMEDISLLKREIVKTSIFFYSAPRPFFKVNGHTFNMFQSQFLSMNFMVIASNSDRFEMFFSQKATKRK